MSRRPNEPGGPGGSSRSWSGPRDERHPPVPACVFAGPGDAAARAVRVRR
ncbi:hypothetical protein STXM2123_1704 [Streptomyces sp. F-3]|nr:hypothetical protein STXM2123_1704 [Streptomyces sp. F-3]